MAWLKGKPQRNTPVLTALDMKSAESEEESADPVDKSTRKEPAEAEKTGVEGKPWQVEEATKEKTNSDDKPQK